MAVKYALTGLWTDDTSWSTTSGGAADTVEPTAADDVIFDSNSGNITITAAAVCRSLDMTSGTGNYAGVLNHDAGFTLSIGDGTAGAGNVALKLVASTYTIDNALTSAISFVSTSTTQQGITWAGNTHGNLTFNGVAGSWIFNDASTGVGTTTTLTNGTLNTNGQTCSWGTFTSSNNNTRVLTMGASNITISNGNGVVWQIDGSNITINANTSAITLTGANTTFAGSGTASAKTYYSVSLTGSGAAVLAGTNNDTFTNFTRTGTAVKTDSLSVAGNRTITGTLRLDGASVTNRLLVASNTLGTARTITAATMSASTDNVDFRDITGAGAASWDLSAKSTGDAGGNTNITFTTAQTQYWVGGTGSWSTAAEWGTTSGGSGGRTPLPQDDTVFDANSFSAPNQDSFMDMPRCGKTLTATAAAIGANTPRLYNSNAIEIYGGYDLSGVNNSSIGNGFNFTLAGRGSFTLTQGSYTGMAGSATTILAAPGGTYTLLDAMAFNSTVRGFQISHGTFDADVYNVTVGILNNNVTTTKVISMGSGTWTITGSGTSMWLLNATGTTLNAETSTILSTATASKTFTGGGLTYHNLTFSGTGTATITIAGSNTFTGKFKDIGTAAHTISFTSNTTQTFTAPPNTPGSSFSVIGSIGNVITLDKSSIINATLSDASGINCCDYLTISGVTATGGASWYAGIHSTGGTDIGWLDASCPGFGHHNNPVAFGGF